MTKNILISLFVLVSCSSIPLPLYQSGYTAFKEGLFNLDTIELNSSYLDKQKFEIIRLRVGRGRSIIMALVDDSNGIKEWISADKIKIYTLNGKIIRTKGLSNDLFIHDYSSYNFDKDNLQASYLTSFTSPALIEKNTRVKIFKKKETSIKNPIIDSKNSTIQTTLFQENIFIEGIYWSAKNKYYVGKSGSVIRTEQYVIPEFGKITIDFINGYL